MLYYFSKHNIIASTISIFLLFGCADVASNIGRNDIVKTDHGVVFGMFKISPYSAKIPRMRFGVALKRQDGGDDDHQPTIFPATFKDNLVAVELDPGQYAVIGSSIYKKDDLGFSVLPTYSHSRTPIITFDLKAGQAIYIGSYTLDVSLDGSLVTAKISSLANDLDNAENQLYLRNSSFRGFQIQSLAPNHEAQSPINPGE